MSKVRVTLASDDNGFQALYLDGRLIGGFGDNLTRNPDRSYEPTVDILANLFDQPEFDGFEFIEESRYQKSFKTWTDYGWEWDAEWPERLEDAQPITYGVEYDLRSDGPDRQDGGSDPEC
jgi:hypothetical protein